MLCRFRKNNKFNIVIGIPTYNEADTISNIVSKIDFALVKYFSNHKSLIINIDSESTDETKRTFLNTKTVTKKIAISGGNSPRGKGINIFKFFKTSQQLDAKYLCIFDGDIYSISEEWLKKLLTPVIKKEADFVSPIYLRNRIEANAIDHFFNPMIIKWFGRTIRQSVGGEFAMNKEFVKYILKQSIPQDAYLFGLATFLVIHAIGGNFKIKEIFLGRKVHKPNFGKITPMFEQMAATTIFTLSQYSQVRKNLGYKKLTKNKFFEKIKWDNKPEIIPKINKDERLINFYNDSLNKLSQLSRKEIKTYLGVSTSLVEKIIKKRALITSEQWVQILKYLIDYISTNCITSVISKRIAIVVTPFLFLRLISFLDEVSKFSNSREAENILQHQLNLFLDFDF